MRRVGGRLACGSQHGFTLLELVIVIVIIAVLLTLAIDKLLAYQVDAERVAMSNVVGGLRSAIGIEVAYRIARDDLKSVSSLVGTNPMDYAAESPNNYLGTHENPNPAEIKHGHWYFTPESGMLIYRVHNYKYFVSDLEGAARARFRIEPVYKDINRNGVFDKDVDRIQGLRLAAVEPYRWTN